MPDGVGAANRRRTTSGIRGRSAEPEVTYDGSAASGFGYPSLVPSLLGCPDAAARLSRQ